MSLYYFKNSSNIPLNIVALFILGASIGLALLPTFEALLDTALDAGYPDDASTYGLIAGLWSGSYSLGEVLGPTLGGFLLDHFGFPVCSTVMAALCILMGIFVAIYYCSFNDDENLSVSSAGQTARVKTTTEVSDSGISENAVLTSSPSSSSIEDEDKLISSVGAIVVNEKTPLLVPHKGIHQKTNNLISSSVPHFNNNESTFPIDILSDEDSFHHESCVQTRQSFPDVLKTVCFTGTGAVEV